MVLTRRGCNGSLGCYIPGLFDQTLQFSLYLLKDLSASADPPGLATLSRMLEAFGAAVDRE